MPTARTRLTRATTDDSQDIIPMLGKRAACILLLALMPVVAPGLASGASETSQPCAVFESQVAQIARILAYADGLRIEEAGRNGGPPTRPASRPTTLAWFGYEFAFGQQRVSSCRANATQAQPCH
jgi:hypothetical protein